MENTVDTKLQVNNQIDEADAQFFDVRKEPFEVYGLYNYRTEKEFKRLPDEIGKISVGLNALYRNTAGGRVRFSTDSDFIIIRAKMSQVCRLPHMPLASSAGFDLYTDYESAAISRFTAVFLPETGIIDGFESRVAVQGKDVKYYTINFPSYSSVTQLEIGLRKSSHIGGGLKYRNILPIVYYGNSVTQGACSSRPGTAYENIVSRRTNTDFINLGFSGSGLAEPELIRYIAGIKMAAFVSDYDYNAPDIGHLKKTHKKMYEVIREQNPNIPYIIMSKFDFCNGDRFENAKRRDVIYETYRYAIDRGDKNAFFIDGASVFRSADEEICTVDGCHPNDYGFYRIANAVEGALRRIWTDDLLLSNI